MTIVIRPLAQADAPAVAALHIETWRDTYRGLMPDEKLDGLSVEVFTERWNKSLQQPNPHENLLTLGAFRNDVLLGFAGAGRPREDWGYQSELWAVNIPKRFQKAGVGKLLVKHCVEYCLSLAAKNMYLYCMMGNKNAEQFYQYLGAVATDRIKPGDGYQEQAWVWGDLAQLRF